MGLGYWTLEYVKVFCGYLFLMFLWPSVVFRGHLRTKSKSYCFSFCVTATIVIVNAVVLTLGLFHVLDQKLVLIVFYGVFAIALFKNILSFFDRKYRKRMEEKSADLHVLYQKHRFLILIILIYKTYCAYKKRIEQSISFENLIRLKSNGWSGIWQGKKAYIGRLIRRIASLFLKYGILMALLIFGMIYFSYGAFQIHSYGAGDLYTHHKWIYGLTEGNIYPDGIYPEAMHCFVYCISTLFRIRVQSVLLYMQGIHVAVFLLAFYLLLRNLFYSKYTPIFVLTLFLILDLDNVSQIMCMYRLQITLPQEFGLHTACLSALYLMNYLNDRNAVADQKGRRRFLWNENLFLFMISVAASVTIHFFVVLMAFFLCFSVCLFSMRKVFCIRRMIPLIASILCALFVSVAPMAGALLQGVPLSGSVNWAVNTITEKEEEESLDDQEKTEENDILHTIYRAGYLDLYRGKKTDYFFTVISTFVLICILAKWKYKRLQDVCRGYLIAIFIANLYVIIHVAPLIGLPDIIPEGRFGAIGYIMFLAVMVIPVDVLFYGLMSFCNDLKLWVLSVFVIIGMYRVTLSVGHFRGFLFYELSRYNSTAEVTSLIVETFPEYSYTIVSPTDELYLVIQSGWHEELFEFVKRCNADEYTLPSEYVFIYVEKKPILYAQAYCFDGPSWIGKKKYPAIMSLYSWREHVSQAPEIIASHISEKMAKQDLPEYSAPWRAYLQMESRTLLESKAYAWCQWFQTTYPDAMDIFYEDDDFVCYYFRQEADQPLYNLGMAVE